MVEEAPGFGFGFGDVGGGWSGLVANLLEGGRQEGVVSEMICL